MTWEAHLLSDVAAAEVFRRRKAAGISRDGLAQRCQTLGWEAMTASVVANIETGRRDSDGQRRREISIDELAVLARALDVPPILLLAPLGFVDDVDVLPETRMAAFRALQWLTGAVPWTGGSVDDLKNWRVGGPPPVIATYAEHEAAWLRYINAQRDGNDEDARLIWKTVLQAQNVMREHGWRIPPWPTGDDGDAAILPGQTP